MNKPLVSIITPTYKHEDFIGECIESVLAQTYDHWEQIIVDDSSTDKTLEIIDKYNDPRIKVIRKTNRGGPASLHMSYNSALNIAKGELIAILEGDDYWPADKLIRQIPVHDNDIVLSWGLAAKRIGDDIFWPKKKWNLRKQRYYPDLNKYLLGNMIPALTVVIRKRDLLTIGGFWQPSGAVLVDYPTFLQLRRLGKFMFLPHVLGFYRIHAQQLSKTHETNFIESSIGYLDEIISNIDVQEKKCLNIQHVQAAQLYRKATVSYVRGDIVDAKKYYMKALKLGSPQIRWDSLKILIKLSLNQWRATH